MTDAEDVTSEKIKNAGEGKMVRGVTIDGGVDSASCPGSGLEGCSRVVAQIDDGKESNGNRVK